MIADGQAATARLKESAIVQERSGTVLIFVSFCCEKLLLLYHILFLAGY